MLDYILKSSACLLVLLKAFTLGAGFKIAQCLFIIIHPSRENARFGKGQQMVAVGLDTTSPWKGPLILMCTGDPSVLLLS